MGEKIDIERFGGFSFLRELYDWTEAAVIAVAVMLLLFTFVFRMVSVQGDSMLPTLQHENRLICSRLGYEPELGDIVVITMPTIHNEPVIKRVIAVEGQTVDIDFEIGIVYIDGAPLNEPYINDFTYRSFDMQFPQKVPSGHVFVLGDNRNNSWDSRTTDIGMVDKRYILGQTLYRLLPYDEMGVPQ